VVGDARSGKIVALALRCHTVGRGGPVVSICDCMPSHARVRFWQMNTDAAMSVVVSKLTLRQGMLHVCFGVCACCRAQSRTAVLTERNLIDERGSINATSGAAAATASWRRSNTNAPKTLGQFN
jgi:hypothetical protein